MKAGTVTGPLVRLLQDGIAAALPAADDPNPELARYERLLRDYPERSGKLLRGTAVLLSAAAHGVDPEKALPAAVALELFQSWVLIHDDIEDDSRIRRGRPALHRQVGMPVALNVGDGLHVHMWRHLLGSGLPRTVTDEFLSTIAKTARGQHLDLSWVAAGRFDVSAAEYLEMVRLKTGWYTVVSPLRLGALCGGLEPADAFTEAGLRLGAAFQIRDDVLNLTSSDEEAGGYGKERAGDLVEAKRTLILAHFFGSAEAGVRQEAVERLSKPLDSRSAEDISWLLHQLSESGSIARAQQEARRLAAAALAVLDPVFSALPDQAAAHELRQLLAGAAERDR